MRSLLLITLVSILYLTVNVVNSQSKDENKSGQSKYKILILTPMGNRSHKNFYMAIANALASKGHEVTVVSTFKESKDIQNIRDIVITGEDITDVIGNPFEIGATKVMTDLFIKFPQKCTRNLGFKEVQDLKKEKFDVVIISMSLADCFMSLVHHFGVPYILGNTMALNSGLHQMAGSIYFDSLAPNILLSTRFPATFLQRLQSVIVTHILNVSYVFFTLPRMYYFCRVADLCPADMPLPVSSAGNNSLVIMNSIRALETPAQPWMPHVIHAGGIHCRPANKLPKDLEDWIQGSGKDGFIFFSLGSAVQPSFMPEEYRKTILKAFASLKYKILWKWNEENMADLPPNVKLSKWLPQQDILGHPKILLFITHGGLLSTQEATYHNCPVLGLPLFADQFNNIRKAVNEGWGDQILWPDLTAELLRSKILSIINNNEIKANVQHRSEIMKDKLNHPADEVVYWIEYVIRHKGAEHMKSPLRHIYWFQLYNTDVWLTLIAISVIILIGYLKVCKYLIQKLFRRKAKRD